MSRQLYLCKEGETYYTVKANHRPKAAIGIAPDPRIEVLDIVDDIDELSGEIIGKKAVINQAKLAAYEAAKAQAEQARQDAQAQKQAKIAQLKATAPQAVKDLMEILGL